MPPNVVPYKFDDFIGDLELITSVGSTDEDKIRLIQRKLRLLIATGNFLPSDAKTPALQRYARHLVHEDPKKRTVTYILPPNDMIHLIENPTSRTTISLHVYGKSTVECNQFDLATKAFKPWKLTYDKPCAC